MTGGSSNHPEIRYAYENWGPLKEAKHYAQSSDTTPIKTITYARNRAGDLTSITDDSIQSGALYTYTVDKLGRTTNATAKYLPGGDRPIDYAYDARGDRTSMVLTDGSETLTHSYGYAADSALLNSATFPSSTTALSITRWPHDGVKVITYPGGVHRDVEYSSRGPVSSIKIYPPSGSTPLESWTYAYTDVLNVDTVTDQASRVTDYGYDNLDRLTSVDHPTMPSPLDTLPDTETFTYDGVGNRTMSGYAHDANHRMRASPGHTYDYDDDGNVKVRDPGSSQAAYTWDLSNQLTGYASGSTSASYVYDPFGRRIKKALGSTTTWYLWNGSSIVAEFNGSGTRQRRYEDIGPAVPSRIAIGSSVSTENKYLVHADRLNTPRVLTSDSSTVVWRAVYEAFGRAHVDEDPDLDATSVQHSARFPGQRIDEEIGTHYNYFRNYDPGIGRFISKDPLGQYSEAHPYLYTSNQPVTTSDPLGLYREDVHYQLTKTLGSQVMDPDTASVIAEANQGYDEGLSNNPFWPWNTNDHFPQTDWDATRDMQEGIENCDPRQFGEGLHKYQDSFSHRNHSGLSSLGHMITSMNNAVYNSTIGRATGDTYPDVDDYNPSDPIDSRMRDGSLAWLDFFAQNCSCGRTTPRNPTSKLPILHPPPSGVGLKGRGQ